MSVLYRLAERNNGIAHGFGTSSLVGCQHLDVNLADVREEINKISNLQGAIAHDIASDGTAVAELVNGNLGSDAASRIASLLLTASLSESLMR